MTRVPKRITVRMLKRRNACDEGIAEFRNLFGQSAAFVPGNIYRAYDSPLRTQIGWLLDEFDSPLGFSIWRRWQEIRPSVGADLFAAYAAALCRLARQNLPKKASAA